MAVDVNRETGLIEGVKRTALLLIQTCFKVFSTALHDHYLTLSVRLLENEQSAITKYEQSLQMLMT